MERLTQRNLNYCTMEWYIVWLAEEHGLNVCIGDYVPLISEVPIKCLSNGSDYHLLSIIRCGSLNNVFGFEGGRCTVERATR